MPSNSDMAEPADRFPRVQGRKIVARRTSAV
jgi:hypothetical protein